MENNKSLHEIIEKLESLFSTFNKHFFNGELEKPIITISPDTTKGAYGWCTSWKAWKHSSDDKEGYYEINMCAEYLARPFLQKKSGSCVLIVNLNLKKKYERR